MTALGGLSERTTSKTSKSSAAMYGGSHIHSFKTWCLSFTRDWPERALLLSISQALLVSALELTILLLTLSGLREMFGFTSGTAGIIVIYFVLFLMAQVFQALLSLDAFWSKNTVQVVAIGVFNVCITAYAFVQIRQLNLLRNCGELFVTAAEEAAQDFALASWNIMILVVGTHSRSCPATDAFRFSPNATLYKVYSDRPPVKVHLITNLDDGLDRIQFGMSIMDRLIPIAIAIASLMIVYNLVGVFTTYKVRQAYGWSIFMTQGASIPKRAMLRRYHLFLVCLKMNIFFSAGILLQMLGVTYYTRKYDSQNMGAEAVVQASQEVSQHIVIPSIVVMVIVGLGFYSLGWYGSKRCSYWLMSCFLVTIMANVGAVCYALSNVYGDPKYRITIIWLTTFVCIQLILNMVTIAMGITCMTDFSKGLYEILNPAASPTQTGRTMSDDGKMESVHSLTSGRILLD